jgi:hypothetical protein
VTTALKRPGQDGQGSGQPADGGAASWPADSSTRRRNFFRDPAWPIVAMLAGWPLWWVLGIGAYMPVLIAIPMLRRMYLWRATGNRRIKVPPGFGLWALFLILMVVSVAMVSQVAPDTITTSTSNRVISWALRAVQYGAVTVILLYAGNLTERELPRKRLAWLLGLVAIYGILFGFLDIALPKLILTSPLTALIPSSIQAGDPTISTMLHPALNQANTFQGRGRPSAPFTYTNWWGMNLAFLLPWLLVAWRDRGTRRQRRDRVIATIIMAVAIIPIVLSFNRGLWIATVCACVYMVLRFAKGPGGMARLGVLVGIFGVLAVVVLASPLEGLISQRLSSAGSETGRVNLAILTLKGVGNSPMLGYGDTRHERGSGSSISVGRKLGCSSCGNEDIGVEGQFWLLLYTSGIPATIFYLAFFGVGAWRYRRDRTPYGLAGELVLLLGFVFMWVYTTVGPPLAFSMLAYALLWKNDRELHKENSAPEELGQPGFQVERWRPAITAGATTTNGMLTRGQEG